MGCVQGCLPPLPVRGAAKDGSHCGCQGKATEWGEEGKSLTLLMKIKGLINPWRSMSLRHVSLHLTSTGMLTVPGGIDPQIHGASVHQGFFSKRMGTILPLGRLKARYCYFFFLFLRRGLPSPWISALARRAVNAITAHKATQPSSKTCSNV